MRVFHIAKKKKKRKYEESCATESCATESCDSAPRTLTRHHGAHYLKQNQEKSLHHTHSVQYTLRLAIDQAFFKLGLEYIIVKQGQGESFQPYAVPIS